MRYLVLTVILFVLFTSCGADKASTDSDEASRLQQTLKGDRYYGGIFKVNEVEYFRSLYPLNVTEVTSHRITNQIYEGLLSLNQSDLSIVPLLAERYEVDSTATQFTFYLRKGVRYHDDPCFADGKGREVTANDFKYCLTKLCEADANNQGYWIFENKVKGCSDYFASTKTGAPLPDGVSGIQVIDDYTLHIELEKPFAAFLHLLAMPFTAVFPKEALDKYGVEMRVKTVGTGPYKLKSLRDKETVFLIKNENYWGKDEFGNQLPYMDGIKVSFIGDRKSELLEFQKGNLDMLFRLPLELKDDVISRNDSLNEGYDQFTLQVIPNLSIQYYGFLHPDTLFGNKNIRKALNYAIDRKKIVDYTLKGSGIPGIYGVVPPAFENYDYKAIDGYEYSPDKARNLLAEAGYPNGEGMPELTLQINSGGGYNDQVAEAVQKMLSETLNIKVNITKLPFAQHLENIETSKVQFWRAGWIADYPDPENFLNLFYSKHIPASAEERSYLNSVRYSSAEFDLLFEQAMQTVDDDERNLLYLKADQQAMNDAAIMPIFYYKDHRLLQPKVKNFPQNGMEYRNFREVYFSPLSN